MRGCEGRGVAVASESPTPGRPAGRPYGGRIFVCGVSVLFGVGRGVAMEGDSWTVPLLRSSGDSGVQGRRRYRPAALVCSTYHGLVRAGCPRWLLRGWLHYPPEADVPRQRHSRAPGPAVGPYRRNMSSIASATRSRGHRRQRVGSGGAPRTSRLGPAPPRGRLMSALPASLSGVGSF